jgi:hypothetical protein
LTMSLHLFSSMDQCPFLEWSCWCFGTQNKENFPVIFIVAEQQNVLLVACVWLASCRIFLFWLLIVVHRILGCSSVVAAVANRGKNASK